MTTLLHNIIQNLDVFSLLAGFGCGLMFAYGIFLSTSLRRYDATIREYEQDLWQDEQAAYDEYLKEADFAEWASSKDSGDWDVWSDWLDNDVPAFDPEARQL